MNAIRQRRSCPVIAGLSTERRTQSLLLLVNCVARRAAREKKAVAAVNALEQAPDFVVFTGDLTYTTDDPKVRRARMAEFRDIVSALKTKEVRFMAGEHDASLDLYPQWDWATRDGAAAIKLLMPYKNVTVFYGHIHQEHHHKTGHIEHHAA